MPAKTQWLIACVLALATTVARAGEAWVEAASIQAHPEHCEASIRLRLDPAPELIEALEQGIGLVLRYEFLSGPWWRRASAHHEIQIGYQPLTRHYLLHPLSPGSNLSDRAFVRRGALLSALEEVPRMRLDDALCAGARQGFGFRARLDPESLPAPLRLTTWFDPNWALDTGWTQWPATD